MLHVLILSWGNVLNCPDARLDHLKTQLAIWGSLRNEIRSPVQESATFKKAVEILERYSMLAAHLLTVSTFTITET